MKYTQSLADIAPEDLAGALAEYPAARAAYVQLPPSHRRQYVEWIEEAVRPETRRRRIEKCLHMLASES